jgi:HEPN domain-containing protein
MTSGPTSKRAIIPFFYQQCVQQDTKALFGKYERSVYSFHSLSQLHLRSKKRKEMAQMVQNLENAPSGSQA